MKFFDVIILGGGASGCVCAISAGRKGQSVAILDKDNRPAKKILVTGNGRCNLTNQNMSSIFFNQNIDNFLERFSSEDTIKFFKQIGLESYVDNEGRIYPLSNSAKSVTTVLELALEESGVKFFGNTEIQSVKEGNGNFVIKTNDEDYCCHKLVYALGGKSIDFAKKQFDVEISNPYPSLVALKTAPTRSLSGSKITNCEVSLSLPNGKKFKDNGEVLFKDNGLSGICIFNLSARLARIKNFKGTISIDIFPNKSEKEIENILLSRKILPRKISHIFDGFILPAIGYEILNRVRLNESLSLSSLSNDDARSLAKHIKNFTFEVKGTYDNNQVISGGVKLQSLTKNLESKEFSNLYFIGEACDVDGECGGYNLQWAFTSGKIVGDNL